LKEGQMRAAAASAGEQAAWRVWAKALWVSRVSITSVLLGLILFGLSEAVQELFYDIRSNTLSTIGVWTVFFFAVVFFWTTPVLFSARILLAQNYARIGITRERRWKRIVEDIPKALFVAILLILALSIYLARQNILDSTDLPEPAELVQRQTIVLGAVCLCLFAFFYVVHFIWRTDFRMVERFEQRHPLEARVVLNTLERWSGSSEGHPKIETHPDDIKPPFLERSKFVAVQRGKLLVYLFFKWIYVPFSLLVIAITLFDLGWADNLTLFKRGALIPVVLGTWVPILSVLALLAHRWRFPVLGASVLVVLLLPFIAGWNQEVRPYGSQSGADAATPRPTLVEAIERWKRLNCGPGENACPRPIIVAAAGGGSRAAFFASSVLGHLQDAVAERSGGRKRFSDRVFAISGVSGGALAAAAFASVVAVEHDCGDQPCPSLPTRANLQRRNAYFANVLAKGSPSSRAPRRTMLQASVADDYFSPIVFSLLFGDIIPLSHDRGVQLEKAWEATFRDLFQKNSFEAPFFSRPEDDSKRWIPLLVLNGASSETGRRIITTPLDPYVYGRAEAGKGRVFRDAYDYVETLCAAHRENCECLKDGVAPRCNLRLSTAVLNSARFPFISPRGAIKSNDEMVDYIVDGGYFDNSGLISALDVARWIHRVAKLKPFVLQISNSPSLFAQDCESHDYYDPGSAPPERRVERWDWLTFYLSTLTTLDASRVARTSHLTLDLPQLLSTSPGSEGRTGTAHDSFGRSSDFAHVWVCSQHDPQAGSPRGVATSWWISAPTQAYLDRQLSTRNNHEKLEAVISETLP
jgi:hypothetical protein